MTLSTHALVVCYAGNSERALDGVSVSVAAGKALVVAGPSSAAGSAIV